MKLQGMAYRVQDTTPFVIDVPTLMITNPVPLRWMFDPLKPLGKATVSRGEDGNLWAEADILPSAADAFGLVGRQVYFAVGVSYPSEILPHVPVSNAHLQELALVEQNVDTELLPAQVIAFEEGRVKKQVSRQEMAGIVGPELEARLSGFSPVEPAPPPVHQVVVVTVGGWDDAFPAAVFSSMEKAKAVFEGSGLLLSYEVAPFDPEAVDLKQLRGRA